MISESMTPARSRSGLRRRTSHQQAGHQRRVDEHVRAVAQRRERHVGAEQARVAVGVEIAEPEEQEADGEAPPRPVRGRAVEPHARDDREDGRQAEHVHHRAAAGERRHPDVERAQQRARGEVSLPGAATRRSGVRAAAGGHRQAAAPSAGTSSRHQAQLAELGERLEAGDRAVDLRVRVRRGDLEAEADLVLGHEREGRERHVDAAAVEELADGRDAVWSRSGTSMIGKPERFGVATPRRSRQSRMRFVMPCRSGAERVAAALVDVEAGEDGRERGDRRRARVEVRRGRDLEQVLDVGRAGDEGQQRRVGLREAADRTMFS